MLSLKTVPHDVLLIGYALCTHSLWQPLQADSQYKSIRLHAQAIVMSKGHTGVKRVQHAYMSTALLLYCTWLVLQLSTPHLCPLSKVQVLWVELQPGWLTNGL